MAQIMQKVLLTSYANLGILNGLYSIGLRLRSDSFPALNLLLHNRVLAALADPSRWGLTALIAAVLLAIVLAPVYWHYNEIVYFDLSLRAWDESNFGPYHALFDRSNARLVSDVIIGATVAALGFDGALWVLRGLIICAGALAYARLAKGMGLSALEATAALSAFLLFGQRYFAGEWVFAAAEAKVFAYLLVMLAIACAMEKRARASMLLLVGATYFHFLVGGFWALAVLGFCFLRDRSWREFLSSALIYLLLVLPMAALLVWETAVLPSAVTSDLDLTVGQIYGDFRHAHHLAPFSSWEEFSGWLPGIARMLGATVLLAALARWARLPVRLHCLWLLWISLYLLAAFAIAYVDRGTQILAAFYLFRPNALLLLLSLMVVFAWLRRTLAAAPEIKMTAIAILALAGFAVPEATELVGNAAREREIPAIPHQTEEVRQVIQAVMAHTDRDDVVVMEPGRDHTYPWTAFERLSGRPSLVAFKFVPTFRDDIVRWYRLIRWREALFAGDCARRADYPVRYLLSFSREVAERLGPCTAPVWEQGTYTLLRVSP